LFGPNYRGKKLGLFVLDSAMTAMNITRKTSKIPLKVLIFEFNSS